jgi:hypothetical protein
MPIRRDILSRGTQIPEYVLEGCLAAFKSPNSPSYLYSNPGLKPIHGKRIVSSLCLYRIFRTFGAG